MKQVLGFVFAAVPAIALLEFNAYVISDRLALAVYDLADKTSPGIFQVDDGADLNAAIHLDARARGGISSRAANSSWTFPLLSTQWMSSRSAH